MCVGECAGPLVDAERIKAQVNRAVRNSPPDVDACDRLDRQVQWTATVADAERGGPSWQVLRPGDDSRIEAVLDSARRSQAELVFTLRVFTVTTDDAGCALPGVVCEVLGVRLRYRDDLWLSLNRVFGIEWVLAPA